MDDRKLLSKLYYHADSIFEFGIGESTDIAAQTNVPSYSGIDSDPKYVTTVRKRVPDRFRFYFADVGETKEWGWPVKNMAKNVFQYQLSALAAEPKAFDIYFVDGRWRMACACASFLHMFARGKKYDALVVIHDWSTRPQYHRMLEIAEKVDTSEFSATKVAVLRLKKSITEDDVYRFWKRVANDGW